MTSHRDDVVLCSILRHHDVTSLKPPLKNPAYATAAVPSQMAACSRVSSLFVAMMQLISSLAIERAEPSSGVT